MGNDRVGQTRGLNVNEEWIMDAIRMMWVMILSVTLWITVSEALKK